jgi:DNA-directed RNA polymerase specialized sigma24 family protein
VQPEEPELRPIAARRDKTTWFEWLFREHYPRVVGVLTRLTGDRAQAEEIAAETFSKLARRSLLPGGAEATARVYRVATNAGLDALWAYRRRRRFEEAAVAEQSRGVAGGGALDDLIRAERAGRVRFVLASMKPRDARLLLLRSSGLACRDIAKTRPAGRIYRNDAGPRRAELRTEIPEPLWRRHMTQCWSEGELRAYLDDELAPHDHERAARHLEECSACRALCADLLQRVQWLTALMEALPQPKP